jgi:glycerol-3-phosphate dehydrogenase subunit B
VTEVLVIGGGMAGAIAALSAKQAGAKVVVARRALGATAMSSGAIDVGADPCAPSGELSAHLLPLEEAARRIARARRHHPYAILREKLSRLGESLNFAAEKLSDVLSPPGEKNILLPTPLGTAKPSAMAQRSQSVGDLSSLPSIVAVVQLGVDPHFNAAMIAGGLEAMASKMGKPLVALPVRSGFFRGVEDAARHPYELAQRFDRPGVLEQFAEELRRVLPAFAKGVLFPPIMGWKTRGLMERLTELLHLPCAELLSASPSVPGLRLQDALDRALERAEIELVEAEAQPLAEHTDRFSLGGDRRIKPHAVILATGKFIAGGIERRLEFRETVFGLPVFSDGQLLRDQYIGELVDEELMGEQPAFRAGVRIDDHLRPLGLDGTPFSPRLYAAGSVIAGYDPAVDKTGLGVAIFTGYLAGEEATMKR